MRRIMLFCLVLLICYPSFSIAKFNGLLDYYNSFIKKYTDYPPYNAKYPDDPEFGEYFIDDFDEKNFYIRIKQLSGDSDVEDIIGVYLRENKDGIIALSKKYVDGINDIYDYSFYEFINNKWIDITDEIFPEIDYKIFFKNNYDLTYIKSLETNKNISIINFYLDIPKIGTITRLQLIINKYENSDILSDKEKKMIAELEKFMVRKEMKFKWKFKEGKLEIVN